MLEIFSTKKNMAGALTLWCERNSQVIIRILDRTMSKSRLFKNAAYAHLAEVGNVLLTLARIEVLELLAQAPRTREVLAGKVVQVGANISHLLQVLKRAQLVNSARDGFYVVYSIAGMDIAQLLLHLHGVTAKHSAALETLSREFFGEPRTLRQATVTRWSDACARVTGCSSTFAHRRRFAGGHLPSQLSLPPLESRLGELPRDRTLVACRRGRSALFRSRASGGCASWALTRAAATSRFTAFHAAGIFS